MKIRVIRAYSGEEGSGPDRDVREGSEHDVTRTRGAQLHANGLVEIIEDEADIGAEPEEKAAPSPENKMAAAAVNKGAPTPRAKAGR